MLRSSSTKNRRGLPLQPLLAPLSPDDGSKSRKKEHSKVLKILVQLMAFTGCFILMGNNSARFQNEMQVIMGNTSLANADEKDGESDADHMAIKRPICPDTRHLFRSDEDALRNAYWQAEKYHNRGGNLKTIQTYLNAQMDETYKMMGITFTPKDSEDGKPLGPDKSVVNEVVALKKANDVNKRGGYDQRQYPGTFQTRNTQYFGDRKRKKIDVIEPHHADRWMAGLGPKFDLCKSVDKIGRANQSYEDKFMCSFEEIRTNTDTEIDTDTDTDAKTNKEQQNQHKCEMISIGSNGQWGFEETIAEMTNCVTHTFDCTVDDPRKPNIDSIHFYPYCVSATNMKIEDREFLTYGKIIEQTGMTHPPSLFKMDVEGFEFDVMAQMLEEAVETGTTHLLPSQISVELHYATRMYDIPWMLRYLQASEISMFMGMMYRIGGYVPVNIEIIGPACYTCAEILFVRAFCD